MNFLTAAVAGSDLFFFFLNLSVQIDLLCDEQVSIGPGLWIWVACVEMHCLEMHTRKARTMRGGEDTKLTYREINGDGADHMRWDRTLLWVAVTPGCSNSANCYFDVGNCCA